MTSNLEIIKPSALGLVRLQGEPSAWLSVDANIFLFFPPLCSLSVYHYY